VLKAIVLWCFIGHHCSSDAFSNASLLVYTACLSQSNPCGILVLSHQSTLIGQSVNLVVFILHLDHFGSYSCALGTDLILNPYSTQWLANAPTLSTIESLQHVCVPSLPFQTITTRHTPTSASFVTACMMLDEVRIVSTDSLTNASKTLLLTSHIVPKHSVTAYVVIVICKERYRCGIAAVPDGQIFVKDLDKTKNSFETQYWCGLQESALSGHIASKGIGIGGIVPSLQ